MIPVDHTEQERVTDAVRVAFAQLGLHTVDAIVQHEPAQGVHLPEIVIRIRVYEPRWSLMRLWWWWHGQAAFDRIERRVRYVLGSLEGMLLLSARAHIFITLEEP